MENEFIKTKITKSNIVLEISKEKVINDFNEIMVDEKVKENRKNKFLQEVLEQLVDHILSNDVLFDIYDSLQGSDNVMSLDDDE